MKKQVAVSILCLAASGALAVEPSVSISDVKLGDHWYGPEWTPEDLKGRVVLYEFWGKN